MSNTIMRGPFTWVREFNENERNEVWRLVWPEALKGAGLTRFVVKNYGGEPGEGFSGWKLVSGGPFDDAGAYSDLDSALDGVTPWLIVYFRARARQKIDEAHTLIDVLNQVTHHLDFPPVMPPDDDVKPDCPRLQCA
jgi:hypothetical protein